MSGKQHTVVFIVCWLLAPVAWTCWAFAKWGPEAAFSTVLGNWIKSEPFVWLLLLVALLMHLWTAGEP